MSRFIEIVEVGARDGLQNEKVALEPGVKIDFIRRLEACGARRIIAFRFIDSGMAGLPQSRPWENDQSSVAILESRRGSGDVRRG